MRGEAERVQILLAWEAGMLTEGEVMRALRMDRLAVREYKRQSIERGAAGAERYLGKVGNAAA